MTNFASNFWDARYSSHEYVYGIEPNEFFKQQIENIKLGKLLLPGEGEGRNAVYAAKQGWLVDSFDQSINAQKKALRLAEKNNVNINYTIVDLNQFTPARNYYNAAAIIFVHFDPLVREIFHKKIIDSLKPGGTLILESFSKNQLGKNSGGPQELEMLYSLDDVMNDFKEMKTILLEEKNILLNEGDKHNGDASVIRFVGEKV
jgi:cyclopropane fatty-acyl-phospholipid synthase-like methyltransferase